MSEFVKKILLEAEIYSSDLFKNQIPDMYAFIIRDVTKFIDIKDKLAVIKKIDEYKNNNGKGLKTIKIEPYKLLQVQKTKQVSGNSSPALVVKLHGIYYLINGDFNLTTLIRNNVKTVDVKLFDLDGETIFN